MTPTVIGAMLGAAGACGVLLLAMHAARMRRPRLDSRTAPYLRDLPRVGATIAFDVGDHRGAWAILAPAVDAIARRLGRMLGGAATVRRQLSRAGLAMSVQEFRVEQVVWGGAGFAGGAALSSLSLMQGRGEPVALLGFCGVCAVVGVLARDYHLGALVRRREERMLAEFPTVADLLALSVAAGEGPMAALDRVTRVAGGELSRELARVLGESRTGTPVTEALDALARRTGLPVVARFAEGFAVAIDRGTPLADVLHAQAADVRDASRRSLMETGARKEVLMMVPVVFLVLPVTVAFAFWPGVVGLRLMTP